MKVLIIQYSSDRNGSTISGLLLADGLREYGWETFVAFGYLGPMEAEYRESGHQTTVIEHKSWLRRSHPLRFVKDLIVEWRRAPAFESLIDEVTADVVYINTAVSLAAAVAAERKGIPVVWHLRELFADVGGEMMAPLIGKPFIRFLLSRLSDKIVVNSKAVGESLLGASLAPSATIIPNAVSADYFNSSVSKTAARVALELPLDAVIVGVPGTLRPVKGHSFFFQAASGLVSSHEDLVFAIAGDGESNFVETLQTEVDDLGLRERVIFMGALNGLTSFYKACDIVCIPSRAEPFGRVVIEAFATGVPVIATWVGGIPEIVDNEVNGLLVPYGEVTSLAHAVEKLLAYPDLRDELANNARQKAKRKYKEDRYKSRIVKLVNSIKLD